MSIFYRNQRVEIQYRGEDNSVQKAIYSHASQVELEKISENGPQFLCVKFMRDGSLLTDRYNTSELIRFRLSTAFPKKTEVSSDGVETTTEVGEGGEEDSADEDYDN